MCLSYILLISFLTHLHTRVDYTIVHCDAIYAYVQICVYSCRIIVFKYGILVTIDIHSIIVSEIAVY